ncbi:NAD(P)-binding protein [Mycena metata]|uniref:NAD(P)-binding protein n=1 Tax=Mycena metata TaxID=1033252 RepID=A0AAD7N1E4_9AGAR|nr:NAD(P)-binding protein [Mycena metata]
MHLGSAVVRALLKDRTFTPRAITRNPASETALKLKAEGAEVVQGDPLDKESLVAALRGSEAVTVLMPPIKAEGEGVNEITQGKNMVHAAKEAGVKFFVFPSSPSLAKISGGKYKHALACDHKNVVEEYLKASGIPNASLHPGTFLENLYRFGVLKKTDTGFDIPIPNYSPTSLSSFTWVQRDVPAVVLALLKNYHDPTKNISGRSYPVVTAKMTYPELAKLVGKALNAEVTFTSTGPIGVLYRDEMYACLSEHNGLFPETPVPNPDLVALGVEFSTVQEFLDEDLKPRFS